MRAGRCDALTPARTASTARRIYLYGEGWNFGEVADNARGVNATQLNMAGTRHRHLQRPHPRRRAWRRPVRAASQEQGFVNGLYVRPQRFRPGHAANSSDTPAAGNRTGSASAWPATWPITSFVDRFGDTVHGRRDRLQRPAGRLHRRPAGGDQLRRGARQPDAVRCHPAQGAASATTMAERVRMQNLGMSLLAFGQGVPVLPRRRGHAALEVARPQQLQLGRLVQPARLHATRANNWGVGLPPAQDNQAELADDAAAAGATPP